MWSDDVQKTGLGDKPLENMPNGAWPKNPIDGRPDSRARNQLFALVPGQRKWPDVVTLSEVKSGVTQNEDQRDDEPGTPETLGQWASN